MTPSYTQTITLTITPKRKTVKGRVLGLLSEWQRLREAGQESSQGPLTLHMIATALQSDLNYVHKAIGKLIAEGLVVRTSIKQGPGGGGFYEVIKAPSAAKENE